jgi:fatty-acyl-CoA synthase
MTAAAASQSFPDRGTQVAAKIAERVAGSPQILTEWFEQRVVATPDAVLLLWQDEQWTYRALDAYANRISAAAGRLGVAAGATVTLILDNSVDALAAIIGLAKRGVGLSILNPDLRGAPLAHALLEVPPILIIAEARCADSLAECLVAAAKIVLRTTDGLRDDGAMWINGHHDQASDPERSASPQPSDTLFHIFTSGTTGLPKAVKCSQGRYIASATSEAVLLDLGPSDRMYVVLPIFHIAALTAIGAAISVGAAVVLRGRFSASRFWQDVREHGVTAMQYLGEIARYVATRPAAATDRKHGLRAMIGAGMQVDVWKQFRDRFGVGSIIECYGSSEGVCSLINLDGPIGSVGRPPPGSHLRIVRLAEDGLSLKEDSDGHLIDCAVDEPGELIGALNTTTTFEGYASADATDKRLVREKHSEQIWYRTGDLFRRDAMNYFYFMDRLGDTFRWKGENISTQQVAAAINDCDGIQRAVVYGVRVQGTEGRAGMALIEVTEGSGFELEAFGTALRERLTAAAMPLFLRIGIAENLTATYKVRVSELQEQGYDSDRISDPVYVLDRSGCYMPIDTEALARNRILPCPPHAD